MKRRETSPKQPDEKRSQYKEGLFVEHIPMKGLVPRGFEDRTTKKEREKEEKEKRNNPFWESSPANKKGNGFSARHSRREVVGGVRMNRDPLPDKGPGGRPSEYRRETVKLVKELAMGGFTNKKIAEILGVTESRLGDWIATYPDLREAVRQGRDIADTAVARSLYQRAVGYSHPDTHITTSRVRGVTEVIQTPITKHYPPDVTACIFWLANRQRETWRHVAHIEASASASNNIHFHNTVNLKMMSNDDLAMARRVGLALKSGTVVNTEGREA